MDDNEFWVRVWKWPAILFAVLFSAIVIITANSDYQKRVVVTSERPLDAGCAYGITATDVCAIKASK